MNAQKPHAGYSTEMREGIVGLSVTAGDSA